MSNATSSLVDRLATPDESGLDAALLIPLLRLLANGAPVTIEQLADESGRTTAEVRTGLAAVPDTEYDEAGRIVGQAIDMAAPCDATTSV